MHRGKKMYNRNKFTSKIKMIVNKYQKREEIDECDINIQCKA